MIARLIGTWKRRLAVAVVVGFVVSTGGLLSILIPSDGTEPRNACNFVMGYGGLLPFNPNADGTVVYSCNPNWTYVAFFIAYIGVPISIVVWIFLSLAWPMYRFHARRAK